VSDERRLNLPPALDRLLQQAVAEIVNLAHPQAIILFGSYAEGKARPDSDFDLVVIARTNNRRHLSARLYHLWHQLSKTLPGLPPADILVYTPRQFQDNMLVGFAPHEAANFGVVLYGQIPAISQAVA
jgi:predicted nucleotidyltransferase